MMDIGEFRKIQEQVLRQWPTGTDVDFDEAVAYHKAMPASRKFPERLARAKERRETLLQPRAGVALPEEHIRLMQYLEKEGEADLLPTTIDSYTRQNLYEEAYRGITESIEAGRSLLNGFPAVNHGVAVCRQVVESVNVPLQVRHGTPDARLLAEICIAGGFSAYEGGGISYNIPYAKRVPLEKTIRDWQYVDRLVGLYGQAGVAINREPFGPLTGMLVPPCISHAVAVLEALLAAEQGVSDITLGYGQCGCLVQDVAAMYTLEMLAEEYLNRFGFSNVSVTTVLHEWMGGFPQDEARTFGVIAWGAATGALSGATKVITKSPHEAFGIPTMEANAQGLRTSRQIVNMLIDQRMPFSQELDDEMAAILEETRCILDKTLELGEGNTAVAAVRAFEAGVIDVPFSPSVNNAGKILPARDNSGAVRFLNTGNLPFNKRILKFHRDKMNERAKAEKREPCFQMVIDDIYAIENGRLTGRPR